MVRERAVDLVVDAVDLGPHTLEQVGSEEGPSRIGRVEDDPDRPPQPDATGHHVLVVVGHRPLLDRAVPALVVVGLDQQPHALDLLAGQGQVAVSQLEAVVFRRIVAAGDHHAAVGPQAVAGVVEDRSRHDADVEDPRTGRDHAIRHRVAEPIRGRPHVAPDGELDSLGPQGAEHERRVCAAQRPHDLFGQVLVDEPADIVLAEDMSGGFHGRSRR